MSEKDSSELSQDAEAEANPERDAEPQRDATGGTETVLEADSAQEEHDSPAKDDTHADSATGRDSQGDAVETQGAVETWRASYLFLGVVAAIVLVLDAVSKWWAETTLSQRTLQEPAMVLIEDVLSFSLAYNKGGAFGMLADENDAWREPFFLLVSIGAVVFIVALYRKLHPAQRALRWGLPLVLGGALGNFADRIAKGKVVDFIDYRAGWVEMMNELIAKLNSGWHVTDHWPTFNVADMAICVGIGLMAIDMFIVRQQPTEGEAKDTEGKRDSEAVASN